MTKEDIENLFECINVEVLTIEDRLETLPIILKESERYNHISNYTLQQAESSDKNSITIPIGVRT